MSRSPSDAQQASSRPFLVAGSVAAFGLLAGGVLVVHAALTFTSTGVAGDGTVNLTGVGTSTIDVGSGTLELQTTNGGPVTFGSGTVTLPTLTYTIASGTSLSAGNITSTAITADQFNSSGSVSISAGGTNQNITLTPSGTGVIDIPALGPASSSTHDTNSFSLEFDGNTYGGGQSVAISPVFMHLVNFASGGYPPYLRITNPGRVGAAFVQLDPGGELELQDNSSNNFQLLAGPTNDVYSYNYSSGAKSPIQFQQGTAQTVQTPAFASSLTVDARNGNILEITLTGNLTFSITHPTAGQTMEFIWKQNSTGGWTVTAPSGLHGFTSPGTTASTRSIQRCTYDGTDWTCDVANLNIS